MCCAPLHHFHRLLERKGNVNELGPKTNATNVVGHNHSVISGIAYKRCYNITIFPKSTHVRSVGSFLTPGSATFRWPSNERVWSSRERTCNSKHTNCSSGHGIIHYHVFPPPHIARRKLYPFGLSNIITVIIVIAIVRLLSITNFFLHLK